MDRSSNMEIDYADIDINKIHNERCAKYGVPYKPAIFGAVKEIIVFGDIHGDYELTIDMLKIANLIGYDEIEKEYNWIGGDKYVVQVGDQIDRCRVTIDQQKRCDMKNSTVNDEHSDIKILKLFSRLDKQARKDGGMVISLLGNHELLNATGYLKFVSYEGLKGFENYMDPKTKQTFSSGSEARAHAFKPGNEYGEFLGCTRYPAVVIGSNIFVHAGIIDSLLKELQIKDKSDIETINKKLRLWLLGLINTEIIEDIIDNRNVNSMFWTRVLGKIKPGVSLESETCQENLKNVLNLFHVNDSDNNVRMIIGHTPQSFLYSDDINSTCGKRIWRVDNGSSQAFDSFDLSLMINKTKMIGRKTQYLKIINDNEYYVCDASGCKHEDDSKNSKCYN